MEVIDAEYQWLELHSLSTSKYIDVIDDRDRRKLTFYFVAEKRIDFRELVRELFRSVEVSYIFLHPADVLPPCIELTKQEFGWRLCRVRRASKPQKFSPEEDTPVKYISA